jgi:hypothetical protein
MGILGDQLNARYFRDGSQIRTKWRRARLNEFFSRVAPPSKARIVDLGGTSSMWSLMDHDFLVTLVNLPGSFRQETSDLRISLVEADATNLRDVFDSKSFDVVYSNSVIEHVGDEAKQIAFAAEVHRLANAFWIQTPSIRFPFEVHTRVPLFWKLPNAVRERLITSWERQLPAWSEMIKGTRVLTEARMRELFPSGQVYHETSFGFEKSYSLFRPYI